MDNNDNNLDPTFWTRELNVNTIEKMSPETMYRLTVGFDELEVRTLLLKGSTNPEQRRIIKAVKQAYDEWESENNIMWSSSLYKRFPDFMEDLQFKIECDFILTEKGWAKERTVIPKNHPMVQLKKIMDEANNPFISNTRIELVNEDGGDKKDKLISEFRQELSDVKKELEQHKKDESFTEEEIDAFFDSDEDDETTNPKTSEGVMKLKKQVKELKKKVADYEARYDPKDVKSKKVISMTGKQHVILFLAVLAHHKRIPNARTNLSFLMSFIASRNESTMKDYLKERVTKKECEDLAILFDDVTPFIADLIRELPEKLEEDKSKKNKKKALKRD